jgi:signal peptidase
MHNFLKNSFVPKGEPRMPKIVKTVWNIFTTVLVILIVSLALLLVGIRFFGFRPYTVVSGSMEPTYHVGSMIYVRPVSAQELEVGDPVTFYLNASTVATHRIIEILPDPADPNACYFRTQGDANNTPDGDPFHSSKLIGKPIFTIPYLGYFSDFVQRPVGRYLALGISSFALISTMVSVFWPAKKEEPESDPRREQENVPE